MNTTPHEAGLASLIKCHFLLADSSCTKVAGCSREDMVSLVVRVHAANSTYRVSLANHPNPLSCYALSAQISSMAVGPEEGKSGFAAGRGRPIVVESPGNDALRRPRGSSMGGVDSKVFVPSSPPMPEMAAAAAAEAAADVAATSQQQFEDAD